MRRRWSGWTRRWAAPLAASAALLLGTCARIPEAPRAGAEPDLRVALAVAASAVRVGGQQGASAVADGRVVFRLGPGESARVVAEGRALRVTDGPGATAGSAGRYERLTFVSLGRGSFVTVGDAPYRGVVELLPDGAGVTAVNTVSLEAYVAGVVNAEMGQRAPAERAALAAQAVVARTYALNNRGKFAAEGYDLRAGVTDQAYGGVAAESDLGWAVARATTGMVLTYRGELIAPFYHSTCGGTTASPEEAFRTGRPHPYLRPVSDRSPTGYYCDVSPRFRWRVEWDGGELRDILRRSVPAVLGLDANRVDALRDVRVRGRGPSGRVTELRVAVGGGEIPVFGPDVRAVLRTPDDRPLGSTAFELAVERGGDRVHHVVAAGSGWGHGVGMCQWGAVGRARAGQDVQTILTTYFPGTRLARWY